MEYEEPDNYVRANRAREVVKNVIVENSHLIDNSANLKKRCIARLQDLGLDNLFNKEEGKLNNLIRSWMREFKNKNEDQKENSKRI